MSKAIPTIQKYMTTAPFTIEPTQTLEDAGAMMREHDIRHLPVVADGRLVGLITSRDVALIESLQGVDPTKETVKSAMSDSVFTVEPDSPLDQVTSEMASQKYGAAVVMQNHKVVGMVTTVDICKALTDLLQTRLG